MKMAKITILIALLPHLLCIMTQRQPSPCSEYFKYITKPGIADMLGQIKIPSPSENDTFFLKVALDTTTEWPSELIRLEMAQSIKVFVGRVRQGRPLLYNVYYPTHEPTPSLSAIWFNNRRYCPDPEVSVNITANVELGHILYEPNKEPLVYSDGPWQLNSMPWHRNFSIYRIDNPNYDRLNYESQLNNECGITSYYTDKTNRLISDGEKTLPGQWPWLVAIYYHYIRINESVYQFRGAGSLLTNRHVITDKNCIWTWNETIQDFILPDPDRVHAFFGQFKSREWHGNHTGIINREIVDYKLYQNTNKPSAFIKYRGLAILILKMAVEFNAFIRPICLWSGSTNLQDIVNMTGYIAGWGFESYKCTGSCSSDYAPLRIYTEEPRTVKLPLMNSSERAVDNLIHKALVVPTDHLRLEFSNVYDRPCDFGSGLMVFNITTGRYQLRGVAFDCNPGNSDTLYFNVPNYLSWIREQISII